MSKHIPIGELSNSPEFIEKEKEFTELDEFALQEESIYFEERSSLLKRRDELGDIFDKGRVALAGGAIALTVTISKELVKSMESWERVILASGWALLAASLMCAVFAVYRAGLAYDRQVDILDEDRKAFIEESRGSNRDRSNKHASTLEKLNSASLWLLTFGLLLSGIALFSAFAKNTTTKESSATIIRLEQQKTGEIKLSNSKKPNISGTQKEQKSFGPKDRPVTPKPPSGTNSSSQQGQSGGDKK